MGLTFLQAIVLHNLEKIKGERTIYSLYHLYQGKRSSQTIQDAHLYQLTKFFHTLPFLTRDQLTDLVDGLIENGFVESISEQKVVPSEDGKKVLERYLDEQPLPDYLNGWKYHQMTDVFWERLTLLIQVCSNLIHRERHFIPVRNKRETLSWVKHYIARQDDDRYKLANDLYIEIVSAFENNNIRPDLIVRRLTGYGKIGLTEVQAAEEAGMELARYHFEFLNGLHAVFKRIMEEPYKFPLLFGLIEGEKQKVPLTLSSEKTFRMLQKGYNIEEIATVRGLKENTIEDHIVEMALSLKEFNINPFVDIQKQEQILQAAKKISAKKLKQIKGNVENTSFFEIRLVLAKYGEERWN